MPGFRPSMVVNFKLFFDESLRVVRVPDPVSVEAQILNPARATSANASVAERTAATNTGTAGGTAAASPTLEPLLVQSGVEHASLITGRVPTKASVELPGYRQAGQFSIDIAFKDLPIDPRTIRSAAVEIHLGAVSDSDFARGMAGELGPHGRMSILDTQDPSGQPRRDTLLMVGFVDEWNMEHGDSGSTVSMKGRDARGFLLDTPVGAGIPGASNTLLDSLDLSKTIDNVVRDILHFNPAYSQFVVEANASEWPGGRLPSPGAPEAAPRHRRGANGQRVSARGTPNGDTNSLNFWDLITRYCYLVGAIPYFQGYVLCIRPSRAIYDQMNAGIDPVTYPTPFAAGKKRSFDTVSRSAISPALAVRRLVYGRDISKLTFERKFAGPMKPKVVRCISHDPSSGARGTGAQVIGRWPVAADGSRANTAARRTRVAPGGQSAQEEILNVPVAGVRDPTQLQEIAKSIYEEIGRGELGGSVETKNLASFGGDNTDPDMLHLRPGDGIELLTDVRNLSSASPLISTLTDHLRNSFDEQVAAIKARIGDENLARVIVATSRGVVQQLQNFFRVANVHYSWSSSGIAVSFDFQNYVVSRNQLDAAVVSSGRPQQTAVP